MAARPGALGMNLAPDLNDLGVKGGMGLHSKNSKKLYREAVKADPIMNNANLIEYIPAVEGEAHYASSGSKCFIKFDAGTNKDYGKAADDVTIAFQTNISDASIDGNATRYSGNEATVNTKYTTCSANDTALPFAEFGYGMGKEESDWWGLNNQGKRLLTMWLSETKGLFTREAFCEVRSSNLAAAPINKSLAINPNILFPDGNAQPLYDSTLADYKTAISTIALAVTPADNHLTIAGLLDLGDIAASDKYIKPIATNSGMYYILYTSQEEIRRLRNSQIQGSIAKDYIDASIPEEVKMVVPSAKLVIDKIILVTDDRIPTAEITAGAVEFGYIKQGKTTTRHSAADYAAGVTVQMNVNMLWGADALMVYERTLPEFHYQDDDYEREKGSLIYTCTGCELPIWDVDSPTDTSAQYEGGMLILTSRESSIAE
jgi:hypothetical protein